jgi:predicted component of type VI protein secretion system
MLAVPEDDQLKKDMGKRWPTAKQLEDYREQRRRQSYRVLLLWLKAALNAVEAGLVSAAAVFLPWLEDAQGQTVAEVALPHIAELMRGSARRLLPEAKR